MKGKSFKRAITVALLLALCVTSVFCWNPVFAAELDEGTNYPNLQEYILDNLDSDYVSIEEESGGIMRLFRDSGREQAASEKLIKKHAIFVKYTLADAGQVNTDTNIDEIYDSLNAEDIIMGQYTSDALVYDVSDASEYYVALIDNTLFNGVADTIDYTFTQNDTSGTVIDGIVYNKETGIAYIPKSIYRDENGEEKAYALQAQLLLAFDMETDGKTVVDVKIENNNERVASAGDIQSIQTQTLDTETVIPVATPDTAQYLALNNFEIYINDNETAMPLEEGTNVTYDNTTGNLIIKEASITLLSVRIVINNEEPISLFGISHESMNTYPQVILNELNLDTLKVGDLFKFNGYVSYCYPNGSEGQKETARYCVPYVYGWANAPEALYELIAWQNGASWNNVGSVDDLWSKWNDSNWYANLITSVCEPPDRDFGTQNFNGNWPLTNSYGGNEIALMCSHTSRPIGSQVIDDPYGPIWARVLVINTSAAEPYIVVGVCNSAQVGQAGVGVYKFRISNPKGYAKLKKESANPTITDGNSCYSLEGAKYGVWKNQACTEGTGVSFTLDASGNSNTLTLTPGDYYVKEYEAPKGYALDKTVYKVTVTSGQTTTLTVKDNPTMDPVGVLLGKVDKETNQNKPQGSATLEGALFEVKFYDVLSETDPAESGKTAKRSWVFRTNENGVCRFEAAYQESGDELYIDSIGINAFPIGTITIQEIQAPEGYLLNPEIYVVQITSENDGSEFVYTYNEPIIPENTLDLNIVKVEKDVEQAIPGAVFRHTLPDGSTEEVTTDEEGKAAFKGLTWGEHTVQEVSVPEGYTINPGKVTFTVEKGNKITVTSNTATDAKGNMTFTVQDDGCALLEVEDTLALYELLLHKQNQFGKVLEGAEFTMYSDKKCTKVVSKGTTKKDGTVSFSKLTVGTTYYLKETNAPEGYRIPVNADGSAIVYEIRTESDPLKDQFEYYVNGKKYTSKTGKFAITGTKAERVVNLTVLNNTGVKLPETGTHAGLLLFLLGIVCMAGIIVYHIKKRKNEGKKNEKK